MKVKDSITQGIKESQHFVQIMRDGWEKRDYQRRLN